MSINRSRTGKLSMFKSKTFWTALVTIGVCIAGNFGYDVPETTQTGLLATLALFLRMGINKVNNGNT